ncbi:hypothetical protein IV38_GL000145 [Lactobacillus selangorensis]|uniref:Restriction endonuclease n=1 Tax=Lactobacillus selangorensis TaxID=81857 RepID=A0A0R2FMH1_9LACO|nr:hypothetical protein [Lactobacillus selangorensis]KRN29263.1 hypothetical protein IV38_GL000145 [Lactobacillus selangorensis]KRN29779.1 hypothetical protein IV40_GL000580 [Lactobacillus selangorensis]
MHLKDELEKLVAQTNDQQAQQLFQDLANQKFKGVPPFAKGSDLLAYLLSHDELTYESYQQLEQQYSTENENLKYFLLGPRSFGEELIDPRLIAKDSRFESAHDSADPEANGSFDAFIKTDAVKIKVEIKATRAAFSKQGKQDLSTIVTRAMYLGDETSGRKFDWNFQQIKPAMADVFILVGTFVDGFKYWVFNSQEIANHDLGFSKGQHRGNVGEGQLHFNLKNIHALEPFLVSENQLVSAAIAKYQQLSK